MNARRLALLALLILAGCAPALIYPEPGDGIECSPATDSVAQQIGSPHRTCRPGQQAGGQ